MDTNLKIMKSMAIHLIAVLCALQFSLADWIQPPMTTESGYRVPQPNVKPQLPRDLGSHPGYAIEWWYWVGHLKAIDGNREFGFQSTVFRQLPSNGQPSTTTQFHSLDAIQDHVVTVA